MTRLRLARLQHNLASPSGTSVWYLILATAAFLRTPRTASLATTAVSASTVWLFATWKAPKNTPRGFESRRDAWIVGALLALAQLCRRAAGEGHGIWWSQVLVPWAVVVAQGSRITGATMASGSWTTLSGLFLLLATGSSAYELGWRSSSPTAAALGLCHAICTGVAGVLIGASLVHEEPLPRSEKNRESLPVEGELRGCLPEGRQLSFMADVFGAVAVSAGVASWKFEGPWERAYVTHQSVAELVVASAISAPAMLLFFSMNSRRGPLEPALWTLAAVMISNSINNPSWVATCLTTISLQALACISSTGTSKTKTRLGPFGYLTIATATIFFSFQFLRTFTKLGSSELFELKQLAPTMESVGGTMQIPNTVHPIKYLVTEAEDRFDKLLAGQSTTLAETAAKYKQRYGIPPPPHFDRWYEFARKNDVQIYDDYDTIHDAMQPFWALKPINIRARVQEAIGFEGNTLIFLMVRNGRITKLEGGLPWQHEAIRGMLESFVDMLPDLDVAFNGHDEPRVLIPHDELSRIVTLAREGPMRTAFFNDSIVNAFSQRPADMTDGFSVREHKASRFNEYAHQNTWVPSRLSCPPDSPARAVNEDEPDATATYLLGPLGFIYNQTAATDICQIPSLHGTHAFFDRPNAFNVAHDLIPIFSESKISSFQDIPFPSMWHWYGKLFTNRTSDMHLSNEPMYDAALDPPWEEKANTMYWRGSTTGAWSQDGGWRRHHRQRLVKQLNGPGAATVLHDAAPNGSAAPLWRPQAVPRPMLAHLLNVSFTGIGQCAPDDCAAQREFFRLAPHAPLATAWRHAHLLDVDGNAFSARFYALLRSRSLVYKAALFREWHADFLVPWLHYVPLGLGPRDDALEALRFFATDPAGRRAAKRLARISADWAARALRRADMEAWMFRALLEYARVVDDNREGVGFPG